MKRIVEEGKINGKKYLIFKTEDGGVDKAFDIFGEDKLKGIKSCAKYLEKVENLDFDIEVI